MFNRKKIIRIERRLDVLSTIVETKNRKFFITMSDFDTKFTDLTTQVRDLITQFTDVKTQFTYFQQFLSNYPLLLVENNELKEKISKLEGELEKNKSICICSAKTAEQICAEDENKICQCLHPRADVPIEERCRCEKCREGEAICSREGA